MRQMRRVNKAVPVLYSPYADVPLYRLSPQEQNDRYFNRTQESFTPYTVNEVLKKVYHRDYADDLSAMLTKHCRTYRTPEGEFWTTASVVVIDCRLVRTESILEQPLCRFYVDQVLEARLRWNLVDRAQGRKQKAEFRSGQYRLRYVFNLRPDILSCEPCFVSPEEQNRLSELQPASIPLNEYLLPIMDEEAMNRYADRLRWEMLHLSPFDDGPLRPEQLVEALDLQLRDGIFEDEKVLGEFFFNHGCARILDPETGFPGLHPIDPGTVVISTAIDKPGLRASAILHECSHRLLATPFFLLQKTHGHKYCATMRRRSRKRDGAGEEDPIDRMEHQANQLPGYLMIPTVQGKARAAALVKSYKSGTQEDRMFRLIEDMAEYYGTTKGMAVRRLLDFGHLYIREYVEQSRIAYRISEEEALEEFLNNPAFRRMLREGNYIRADGCYCRDEQLLIRRDREGKPHLSAYAQSHLRQSCLRFQRNGETDEPGAAVRKTIGHRHTLAEFADPEGNLPTTQEGLAMRERIEQARQTEEALQKGFGETLIRLMAERNMSVEQLAERTGFSIATVRNLRNDRDRAFPIEEIVALCIALQLEPRMSRLLVELSPAKFLDSTDMRLYEFAMLTYYDRPVSWVNRWLLGAGAPPLTSLIDGYDKDGNWLAS